MKKENTHPGLIYPIALVMALDALFTLIGQPEGYWTNFSRVNEGSTFGFLALTRSPFLFTITFLAYMFVVVYLFKKLPHPLDLILGLTVFLGHTFGSSTWIPILYAKFNLPQMPFSEWYATVLYFVLLSVVSVSIAVFSKGESYNRSAKKRVKASQFQKLD